MNRASIFRFNILNELPSDAFGDAMSEADLQIKHEMIAHTELVAADRPYVVIRAQLERHIDEAELLELADDLDSRFTLEGKALTAELEEASLTYIEA